MRKNILAIIIFVITLFSCSDKDDNLPFIQPFAGEIDWILLLGGSEDDVAQKIIETSDGGYAIVGYTSSTDGDIKDKDVVVNDFWVTKIDAQGNIIWSKTYGGSGDDKGQAIVETSDGGFAVVGYSMSSDGDASNNEGFHDNWLLKLDAAGNLQWEKSYGFAGHDHAYDLLQTQDGGFFFVGFLDVTASGGLGSEGKSSNITAHGVGEFWGTKVDANGNLEWRRYFGGSNNDRAHAVAAAPDGGFVIAGFSESEDFDISNSKGSYDFWVVKVNAEGNKVWEQSFGGSQIDIAYAMTATPDNAYVIVGNTFSSDKQVKSNNGGSDIWMIKINDKGELLWEKTIGGSDFDDARGVSITRNGGFLISGNSKSTTNREEFFGENDAWLIKTDANGNLVWEKSFGGSSLDFGFHSIQTQTNKVLFVGTTESTDNHSQTNKGKKDALIVKLK